MMLHFKSILILSFVITSGLFCSLQLQAGLNSSEAKQERDEYNTSFNALGKYKEVFFSNDDFNTCESDCSVWSLNRRSFYQLQFVEGKLTQTKKVQLLTKAEQLDISQGMPLSDGLKELKYPKSLVELLENLRKLKQLNSEIQNQARKAILKKLSLSVVKSESMYRLVNEFALIASQLSRFQAQNIYLRIQLDKKSEELFQMNNPGDLVLDSDLKNKYVQEISESISVMKSFLPKSYIKYFWTQFASHIYLQSIDFASRNDKRYLDPISVLYATQVYLSTGEVTTLPTVKLSDAEFFKYLITGRTDGALIYTRFDTQSLNRAEKALVCHELLSK